VDRRFNCSRAQLLALAAGCALPVSVRGTTLFDANTGLSKTDLPGVADFGQQISFAGANEPYTLSSISFLGTWWTNVSAGSQMMLLEFYTGANLSPSATNALQSATLDTYAGYYSLTPPAADGTKSISFSLPAHTVVPSSTFTLYVQFGNLNFSQYSTAVCPLISMGTPVTGADPGFCWIDQNGDGVLSGSEQMSGANIDIAISGSAGPTTYLWNNLAGGDWDAYGNWNPYGVPTSVVNAAFNLSSNPVTAAGYTVTVSHSADICQTLTVESDRVSLAVASANSASGSSAASLTVTGALTVGAPAVVGASGTTYGFLTLSETGAGGPVNVSAGSIVVGASGGVGFLTVGKGVRLSSSGGVTLGTGSSIVIEPGGSLATPSINLAGSTDNWTSIVDISTGSLDLSGASLAIAANQVKEGYNLPGGANWNGAGGITSSIAASDTSHLTAVGVILNNQSGSPLYGNGTASPTFAGTAPGPGDVLVKFTYFGDANLDGIVDGSDYSLIDAGYLSNQPGFAGAVLTGWYNGDFNYDGVVDGSDYALMDNAFNNQGAPQLGQDLTIVGTSDVQSIAVPEPSALILLAGLESIIVGRTRCRPSRFLLRSIRHSV
jgi:hypothetical protein